MVLVAHPDDETIGCGAIMQRMREGIVVFCTDGAPRNDWFWKQYGSREAYAKLRQDEARTSLAQFGIKKVEFLAERDAHFVDQDLFHWLPQAYDCLQQLVQQHRPDAMITIAYEGGHPDHDSVCILTATLAERFGIPAWEFPLYNRAIEGGYQNFIRHSGKEVSLKVSDAEFDAKVRALADYASQHITLGKFDARREVLRPMVDYDFTCPPHVGETNYEVWQWGISSRDVCRAFSEFLAGMRTSNRTERLSDPVR
jgi:LmbE family N-acetylglucosaminyl deacetylase